MSHQTLCASVSSLKIECNLLCIPVFRIRKIEVKGMSREIIRLMGNVIIPTWHHKRNLRWPAHTLPGMALRKQDFISEKDHI